MLITWSVITSGKKTKVLINLLTQELAKIWEISSDDEADDSVNHVTRSGKHYPDPPMPEREGPSVQDKGKQKVVEEFDEDAVLKQLKQTKANASVWDLLVASKKHRDAMYEALGSLMVSTDSTPQELAMLVGFKDDAEISFSEKDLPADGRKHNRALYIRAEVKGFKWLVFFKTTWIRRLQ